MLNSLGPFFFIMWPWIFNCFRLIVRVMLDLLLARLYNLWLSHYSSEETLELQTLSSIVDEIIHCPLSYYRWNILYNTSVHFSLLLRICFYVLIYCRNYGRHQLSHSYYKYTFPYLFLLSSRQRHFLYGLQWKMF